MLEQFSAFESCYHSSLSLFFIFALLLVFCLFFSYFVLANKFDLILFDSWPYDTASSVCLLVAGICENFVDEALYKSTF